MQLALDLASIYIVLVKCVCVCFVVIMAVPGFFFTFLTVMLSVLLLPFSVSTTKDGLRWMLYSPPGGLLKKYNGFHTLK